MFNANFISVFIVDPEIQIISMSQMILQIGDFFMVRSNFAFLAQKEM